MVCRCALSFCHYCSYFKIFLNRLKSDVYKSSKSLTKKQHLDGAFQRKNCLGIIQRTEEKLKIFKQPCSFQIYYIQFTAG